MSTNEPDMAFNMELTVTDEHVDFQGHLSNVAVLHLMNSVTLEHSKSLGWDAARYRSLGGMFVVRRHEIDYLKMAFLHDRLKVVTWVVAMAKTRAERRHRIVRQNDGAIIAEGINFWIYVDVSTGRPERIPAALIDSFVHPVNT